MAAFVVIALSGNDQVPYRPSTFDKGKSMFWNVWENFPALTASLWILAKLGVTTVSEIDDVMLTINKLYIKLYGADTP